MRTYKRLISLLLVTAALAALLVSPVQAAFTDVQDPAVAEAAEALRVMGVLDGTGNGAFSPSATLTRAQFTKMIVLCMGLKDEVAAYETRTIFTDVRSHWAKGYINLAATRVIGGSENGYRLIAGIGDGTFCPDRPITYGEAVTILLRALGYGEEASRSWPHSAVSTAASIGLSDGLPALAAGGTIDRGRTAILFRNFLLTEIKDGKDIFVQTVHDAMEDVILLSADSDGVTVTGASKDGDVYKVANELPSSALIGRRGTMVLEKKTGKFLTFLPDKSTRVTATVSKNATARAITITGGHTYSVDGKTPLWNGEKETTFGEAFSAITTGKTVTLYLDEGGSVDYVYLGSAAATGNAMVAKNKVNGNPFTSLTGGVTNYSIYKNGAAAQVSDLRQYDVAVYDSVANTLRVSDLRITGILENAKPNLQTPDEITVMGTTFQVLDCAHGDLAAFKLGDMVTMLLTETGEVAGVVSGSTLRATAVGLFDEGTITLLGSGIVLKPGAFSNKETDSLKGQLVNVTSYQKGKVSLSRVSGSNASGSLNVAAKTVGTLSLAPGVKVYDRVGNGAMTEVELTDLVQNTVPASRIDFVRRDYAGRIDVLVLKDVTGNGYTYGRLEATENTGGGAAMQLTVKNAGQGRTVNDANCTFLARDGVMGGVALSAGGSVAAVITLESVQNVDRSRLDAAAMTFSNNGQLFPISDEVQCFLKGSDVWMDADELSQALGFSEKFTVYYDRAPEEGGKVRVIVAE